MGKKLYKNILESLDNRDQERREDALIRNGFIIFQEDPAHLNQCYDSPYSSSYLANNDMGLHSSDPGRSHNYVRSFCKTEAGYES